MASMYLNRFIFRLEERRFTNAAIGCVHRSFAASETSSEIADGSSKSSSRRKLLHHDANGTRSGGGYRRYSSRSKDHQDDEGGVGGKDLHRLYEEQLREMKDERELLFGFTESDHSAWTSAGGNHRHDESFLDEINAARFHHEHMSDEGRGLSVTTDMHIGLSKSDDPNSRPPTELREMPTRVQDAIRTGDIIGSEPHESSVDSNAFSHVSSDGTSVRMVDVGHKAVTPRMAVAQSRVVFPPEVAQAFARQGEEWVGPKGPIFATAKLAGIMAAKRTSDLIPLCHPLPLDSVNVDITLVGTSVAVIQCECRVTHKTGVEMEAMTGATIAALTVYDMVKAVSHRVRIEDTVLISKAGGKRTV